MIAELETQISENLNINETNKDNAETIDEDTNKDENNLNKSEIDESDDNEADSSINYDEEAWITPENLEKVKKINQLDSGEKSLINNSIPVGCITSDFSMQVNNN